MEEWQVSPPLVQGTSLSLRPREGAIVQCFACIDALCFGKRDSVHPAEAERCHSLLLASTRRSPLPYTYRTLSTAEYRQTKVLTNNRPLRKSETIHYYSTNAEGRRSDNG